MKNITFIIIFLIILGGCSLKTNKNPIVINNEFLTHFFYQSGSVVIYENIGSKYLYTWTGENRRFIPKIYYTSSNIKISRLDNIWVKGRLLIEYGNYIHYLNDSKDKYFQNISVFGYFKGKPFICTKKNKSCKIIKEDSQLKSLIFNPLFDKNLYKIERETIKNKFTCYKYKNLFQNLSTTCIDNDGLVIYQEDSMKKIIINSYILKKIYGTNINVN